MKPRDLKPIKWNDEDLDRLAIVTPDDTLGADALWRTSVDGPMRELLAAEPEEDAIPTPEPQV